MKNLGQRQVDRANTSKADVLLFGQPLSLAKIALVRSRLGGAANLLFVGLAQRRPESRSKPLETLRRIVPVVGDLRVVAELRAKLLDQLLLDRGILRRIVRAPARAPVVSQGHRFRI